MNRERAPLFRQPARLAVACLVMALACAALTACGADPARLVVVGDAVPEPLAGARGDADRGRALLVAREDANCVLCHTIADAALRYSGNIGPPLDGVAKRLSVGQLRLRVADNLRVNPASAMPSYYRVEGLDRVAGVYRGRPILDAGQIEDIVAYLATLQ